METSLSAADPAKYYWMRMNDKGRTVTADDGSKVKIAPKSLFGVRELRGKQLDEVLLVDGTRFKLAINKSEALMNIAKQFNGKVPAIKPAAKAEPVKVKSPVKKTTGRPVMVKPTPFKETKVLVKPTKVKVKVIADVDKRKIVNTQMTVTPEGHTKVKLKDVNLPELDDFTDNDLPAEFRRYQIVESTGVKVEKMHVSFAECGDEVEPKPEVKPEDAQS